MILPSNSGSSVTQKNNICQKKRILNKPLGTAMFLFVQKISHFLFKKVSQVSCEKFSVFIFLHRKIPRKNIPKKKEVCFHWKKFLVKYKNKHWLWISIPIERMMLCITDIHIMIIIFSRKVSSKVSRKTPRVLDNTRTASLLLMKYRKYLWRNSRQRLKRNEMCFMFKLF